MIEYLLGLLNVFLTGANLTQAKKQEKSEVISTIRNALRATKKHIQENRSGEFGEGDFSDVDSKELSDMWSSAAKAIRPSDPGLANIFEEKATIGLIQQGLEERYKKDKEDLISDLELMRLKKFYYN